MPDFAPVESPGSSWLEFESEDGELDDGELADGVADDTSVAQLGGPK